MPHRTETDRPWLSLYTGAPLPDGYTPGTLLELFGTALAHDPAAAAVRYFDGTISYAELDAASNAVANDLLRGGFAPGDRLGIYMQNMPQFVIACLATWKAGGIVVTISPMNRAIELGKLLPDCTPTVIVVQDELVPHLQAAIAAIPGYEPRLIATSPHQFQQRNDARVLPRPSADTGLAELTELINAGDTLPPPRSQLKSNDIAALIYTSGTTGQPKGAMLSHANFTHNAQAVISWYHLETGMGPILGLAPLFHVTGLIHMPFAWNIAQSLVLTYRFQPDVVIEAIVETRPSFTVAAITAYIALLNNPDLDRSQWTSFQVILSGGAPVPPAVIGAFEERTGRYIHNGYGLTETAAGIIAVPFGARAPVDPVSQTLSIGVPKYGVDMWIAGEDGQSLAIGEIGEIVVSGTAVSPGYWRKPAETADAMRPDGFRTGDVGFIDQAGWVYLVDRKKDMISSSGFKVWPREVEDVLYTHPAVREAGVTGIADAYRGEAVQAVISLKSGQAVTTEDIVQWCKDRMAAYKVPREVLIVDDLPKTPSGKILRRELRALFATMD